MLILVDDLRPQLKAYAETADLNGIRQAHTPAMDRLAEESFLFENAFCNIPVCGASRLSLMTGLRPYKEPGEPWGRQWDYDARLRDSTVDEPAGINYEGTTLPQHFKNNGYRMLSIGKVYHNINDDREVWDDLKKEPQFKDGKPPFEIGEGDRNRDEAYIDGRTATDVVGNLETLKDEPFFYAVGFHRPHLPFNAPKKYWDLYPEGTVRLPDNYSPPVNAPKESLHNWGELRRYAGLEFADESEKRLTDDYARALIRGYWASVSYVDAQIAKIVAKLKTTRDSEGVPLYDKTIIVLWGDHGYNLGEHGLWAKHAVYLTSLQIPLLIRDPDSPSGARIGALVETVDLYPTLCEMAGVGLPADVGDTFSFEGTSLVPLMENPDRPWKQAIFGRFKFGDTVRTERYAYSEFVDADDKALSSMLYDLRNDPGENRNIVDEKPELAARLSELLGGGTAEGKRVAWKKVVDVRNANMPVTDALTLPEPN